MFDPTDIHIILIGCQRAHDYRVNLEILRYNYMNYGPMLWITTVFNGDQNECASGAGENTFIYLPENRGYGYGALDSFNEGLDFARTGYRPYVAIFNFDVWFLTQNGFEKAMSEFIESGRDFAAGYHQTHHWAMTDCMFFRREFLESLLPIQDRVLMSRKANKWLENEMSGTELGFNNMEEWMMYSLNRAVSDGTVREIDQQKNRTNDDLMNNIDPKIIDTWFQLERDGHPRYRLTKKYDLIHEHDDDIKRQLLEHYKAKKGHNICKYLGIKIEHNVLNDVRQADGSTMAI
tara:strand:- start:227 stop:1099 length:873 start_codon:yes stop_codon:yes gene_type:complete